MRPLHLGLIGYPLGHSRSPAIHIAALKKLDIAGDYRLYPVEPLPLGEAVLRTLIECLRGGEIHGLNVTIPHKQSVMPLLDELSPAARQIGAVNTILLRAGRVIGENTDAAGFLAHLRRVAPDLERTAQKTALLLGAGGAARAALYALLASGWQVILAARRVEQAKEVIRDQLSGNSDQQTSLSYQAFAIGLDQLQGLDGLSPSAQNLNLMADNSSLITDPRSPITNNISHITLIVNTTPVGMEPNVAASPWPDKTPFPPGAIVYDMVYNPQETLLIKQARQAGLTAFSGLGMLVEQAALAFELWSGREAPREVMLEAGIINPEPPVAVSTG